MQRQDLVTAPADPMLVPEAAHKFAQQALREHQRAEKNVLKAVEHAVKSGQGEVYFIEAVGADRVKIGVSSDVGKRFKQLAASFPGPLRLLGTAAGGRAREASLHRRLADFHIGGEWFHLTPGVRAVVKR
ncbi:MAG: GIY-YIG nuclease family protein [Pirellulales bacterium]